MEQPFVACIKVWPTFFLFGRSDTGVGGFRDPPTTESRSTYTATNVQYTVTSSNIFWKISNLKAMFIYMYLPLAPCRKDKREGGSKVLCIR